MTGVQTCALPIYTLLRDWLPGVTLVSVGHRSTLRPFHARRLVVTPKGAGDGDEGPATLVEVAQTA